MERPGANVVTSLTENSKLVPVLSYSRPSATRSKMSLQLKYRTIPKVTTLVTFGFSRLKGPLLSGSGDFQQEKMVSCFQTVKKTFVR